MENHEIFSPFQNNFTKKNMIFDNIEKDVPEKRKNTNGTQCRH